jgi:hypothetical protein
VRVLHPRVLIPFPLPSGQEPTISGGVLANILFGSKTRIAATGGAASASNLRTRPRAWGWTILSETVRRSW